MREGPLGGGLFGDFVKRPLGHAGIMLEIKRHQRRFIIGIGPHRADKTGDTANTVGLQQRQFSAGVEIRFLNGYLDHQPPVTGGKKAISPAPARLASWPAIS